MIFSIHFRYFKRLNIIQTCYYIELLKKLHVCLASIIVFSSIANAEIRFPKKPVEGKFVVDQANLLSTTSITQLESGLAELLKEMAIPIIFLSIHSQQDFGAGGMSIETYARILYDEWGIGHKRITVKGRGAGRSAEIPWNKGILLLVSVKDRKARIELGAGFGLDKDAICQSIMSEHIIPFFKAGDYEGGILTGIRALSQMAKGETVEPPPRPWWHYGAVVLVVILAVFTIVSLVRRGSSGWAWLFWAAVFSLIIYLLIEFLTSTDGDGFSGGSCGGGFSGGGGASGSW
tara:strand:- start:477 stop:1346 length:870 start_codon:yes stop_codon:yes gene_type:complete